MTRKTRIEKSSLDGTWWLAVWRADAWVYFPFKTHADALAFLKNTPPGMGR